jgi:hypothetical protein
MLTSITPLGERSRKSRWAITVAAFAVGALAAGAALGLALGWLGALSPVHELAARSRIGLLALALLAGLALDLEVGGLRLPSTRRQVNEDWLRAYRGWVYGGSFGAQLGLGLVTVATTSMVYVTFVASLLSASPLAGATIGATFGLLRAATLVPARGVTEPAQLLGLGASIRRLEVPARRIALVGQALLALLAAFAAGSPI